MRENDFRDLANIAEIPDGSSKSFQVSGHDILICHTKGGLELDGPVCSALRHLADELQLAIPPALVEIASAAARADGTRTW